MKERVEGEAEEKKERAEEQWDAGEVDENEK